MSGYLIYHFRRAGFNACFAISALLTGIVCGMMSRIYAQEASAGPVDEAAPDTARDMKQNTWEALH